MKRMTSMLLAFSLIIAVAGCASEEADTGGPALAPASSDATTTDEGSDTAGSADQEEAGSADKEEAGSADKADAGGEEAADESAE